MPTEAQSSRQRQTPFLCHSAKGWCSCVTIHADEVTATVEVKVAESVVCRCEQLSRYHRNNSTGWWTVFSDNFNVPGYREPDPSMPNYTSQANSWNNFAIVLRKAICRICAMIRADNYGWGAGYDGNASLVTTVHKATGLLGSVRGKPSSPVALCTVVNRLAFPVSCTPSIVVGAYHCIFGKIGLENDSEVLQLMLGWCNW